MKGVSPYHGRRLTKYKPGRQAGRPTLPAFERVPNPESISLDSRVLAPNV